MRILIAPDKFKDSLGAREVAANIEAGLRDVLPQAEIEIMPVADGGEGTAEVICRACAGEWVKCAAHDALGRAIEARYVWLRKDATAVIEMNEAAGLWQLTADERDPFRANTFGVGEMLLDATDRGAQEIIIGLGGSATNDGGFGMARALRYRFLNEKGGELSGLVSDLLDLDRIAPPHDLEIPSVTGAADVRNPLLGERGATRTFGRQKGAWPDELTLLEDALARLADVVARDLGSDFRGAAGAGAAGGLGFGLMNFCRATLRTGFDLIAEMIGLESKIKDVDVVVTGEGSLDEQSLAGKAPAGVARFAKKFGKRVYALAGHVSEDRQVREMFDGVYELGGSISQVRELLMERARELAMDLKKTSN